MKILTKHGPPIVTKDQALQILLHFPAGKRNFRLVNIFKGSRDGWTKETFIEKVFKKGATLVLVKTTNNAICGGFTSIEWDTNNAYKRDTEAFVFNLNTKYLPCNYDKGIYRRDNGFEFGTGILRVDGSTLNSNNEGCCYTGKPRYYDIEGDSEGKSPLTGEKNNFTVAKLEVYKVFFN